MTSQFTVKCPKCASSFPVHTELWNAEVDLLCPFCGAMFPQAQSPEVIGQHGEKTVRQVDTSAVESM